MRYEQLAKKVENGKSVVDDTITPLKKGEKALVAFVGFGDLGTQPSKFSDKGNPVRTLVFEFLSGRLCGTRFCQKVTLSLSPKGALQKYLKAVSKATGNERSLNELGYIFEVEAYEKSPIWHPEEGWSISKPPEGTPEFMEIVADTDFVCFGFPESPLGDAEYLAEYKAVCNLSSFFATDLAKAAEFPGSRIYNLINKPENLV